MQKLLDKAKALTPSLFHKSVTPAYIVRPVQDDGFFQGWRMEPMEPASALPRKDFADA